MGAGDLGDPTWNLDLLRNPRQEPHVEEKQVAPGSRVTPETLPFDEPLGTPLSL